LGARGAFVKGREKMKFHKEILEWQAAHPNITWVGWGIVWAVVIFLFVRLLLAQMQMSQTTTI
jgi:hypothetical protein